MSYICRVPTDAEAGILYDDGTGKRAGECVSLVKYFYSGAGHFPQTSYWKRGEQVKESKFIQPGTAIATFSGAGNTFWNGGDHAAIFIGKAQNGIWLWEQFLHKTPTGARKHLMIYGSTQNRVNNGDNFYIIE